MVKITRKREIMIERERSVTIRFGNLGARAPQFCALCQTDSRFLTIDEAAITCGLSSLEVFRLVEDRKIHWIETRQGLTLICLASLAAMRK